MGVGLFASHYLNRRSSCLNKRREAKLWVVILIILVSTFLQLTYDSYEDIVQPNDYCLGLFAVFLTQSRYQVANAVIWLANKVFCNFSVDLACVYAFWPVRKIISPLLKPADNEDTVIHSILSRAVQSSVGTDSNISWEEDPSA